jgi:hypothetical protein
MTLQKVNTRNTVLVLMIVAAAAFRFVSYKYPYVLSNFTPVGAIALFGGAYFTDKWKAFLVPLVTLFVSDILLNYLYISKLEFFYNGAIWVYLCFAIIVFIGTLIKKSNVVSVLSAGIVAVVIHWLIMDLPWLYGNLYPHTFAGYGQSLIAAIPFEKNMLFGDLLFGLILFGGFELAKNKYGVLRAKTELAV